MKSQILAASLVCLTLAGCNKPANERPHSEAVMLPAAPKAPAKETSGASIRPSELLNARKRAPLAEYFDCVRKARGMLIAAHRGGSMPGFAENSLETLKHARDAGFNILEVDVQESRDGVLFLHHDERLNRTTGGDGYVSDTAWEKLASLKHRDEDGKTLASSPVKFTDVLLWAKSSGAILEIDRKTTTSFKNMAAAVKAAGAEDNVIYITYSDQEAAEVARLVPHAMLTATAYGDRNVGKLEGLGIKRENLIAWTGTREAYPDAWERVREIGVEPAFGTLGREGESIDDTYWQDGDGSEYEVLAQQGLVLLATDESYRVADAITADDKAIAECGR